MHPPDQGNKPDNSELVLTSVLLPVYRLQFQVPPLEMYALILSQHRSCLLSPVVLSRIFLRNKFGSGLPSLPTAQRLVHLSAKI